jgi:hypothetical protein
MQNINIELFSRLFLLNLSNTFRKNGVNNDDFSLVTDSNSSNSGSSGLEPPTPPRTPIISSQKINEKNFNNNNEDSKENYGGNSSSFLRNSRDLSNHKSIKSESDFESSSRRSSHFHDDSEDGRESVVSGTNINGNDDDSDHEESDFSSFEKISMKNIENFLDKSSLVSLKN